jgi:hypothetical protein
MNGGCPIWGGMTPGFKDLLLPASLEINITSPLLKWASCPGQEINFHAGAQWLGQSLEFYSL